MSPLESWLLDMTAEKQLLVMAMCGLGMWLLVLAARPKPKRMAIATAFFALAGSLSSLLIFHADEIHAIDSSGWACFLLTLGAALLTAPGWFIAYEGSKAQKREMEEQAKHFGWNEDDREERNDQ